MDSIGFPASITITKTRTLATSTVRPKDMMLVSLLFAPPIEGKVVSASLFKNGYAVVVREWDLPGTGTVDAAPIDGVLGTLWITASNSVTIKSVTATQVESASRAPASSIGDLLRANIGREVTASVGDKTFSGKVLGVSDTLALFQTAEGVQAILLGTISRAQGQGLVWEVERKSKSPILRIEASGPSGGKVRILSLERGATWAPSYSLDISDPKTLELTAKATLLTDRLDLSQASVRLITGFPNIPYLRLLDPLSVGQSLDQFVNSLLAIGTPADFRGLGGQMAQNALRRENFDDAFPAIDAAGTRSEDLFFYPLPKVALKPGDRGLFVLFGAKSPFRHVYECELNEVGLESAFRGDPGDVPPPDVWHSVTFTNSSGKPLTTGPAVTVQDGEILGQDLMSYTAENAPITVKITKALDVAVESTEEEVSRSQREVVQGSSRFGVNDIVLKGTIRIVNRKAEAIELELKRDVNGEILGADANPKRTGLAKGLNALNPRTRLTWAVPVKPGETLVLTYRYRVVVRL